MLKNTPKSAKIRHFNVILEKKTKQNSFLVSYKKVTLKKFCPIIGEFLLCDSVINVQINYKYNNNDNLVINY